MRYIDKSAQVVVVTGAAAGVGRAIAHRFAAEGAALGLISRDEAALKALADELRERGNRVSIAAVDVADASLLFQAAEQFERELGPIDVWVNDAMLTVFSTVADITPEEFRRVTEATYLGTVHGCMAALKEMRPRNKGQIINIGSALAYRGIPLQSAYCGAKHAIRGFTASLRSELKNEKSNIALSILELPAMNTPQFDWARLHMMHEPKPMGTIYRPEAAAEAVLRASRTKATEYWVGASTLMTIVGNMIAPEFMDWFLARTAVKGQQTAVYAKPGRKDNLFGTITTLHRTDGRFGAEARPTAVALPGQATRAAIVAGGAAVFFALGSLAGAILGRARDTRRDAMSGGRFPARSVRGS